MNLISVNEKEELEAQERLQNYKETLLTPKNQKARIFLIKDFSIFQQSSPPPILKAILQKEFYEKIHSKMGAKRKQRLEFWRKTSLVYLPALALIFVCLYWLIGLKSAGLI